MVIELSGAQFCLKALSASSIWNPKYDFRAKLHDTKFNYHFITPILKSHSFFFWNINIYLIFTSGNPVSNLDGLKKGCDLEQNIVRFVNKLHCWEPVRLQE